MPSSILTPEITTKTSSTGKSIVTSLPEIQPVTKAPTQKLLAQKITENIITQTAKEKGLITPIVKKKPQVVEPTPIIVEMPLARRSMDLAGGGGGGATPEEESEAVEEETPTLTVEGTYNTRNVLIIVGLSVIGWYFFNKYKK